MPLDRLTVHWHNPTLTVSDHRKNAACAEDVLIGAVVGVLVSHILLCGYCNWDIET